MTAPAHHKWGEPVRYAPDECPNGCALADALWTRDAYEFLRRWPGSP